jgi:hypothetical protein
MEDGNHTGPGVRVKVPSVQEVAEKWRRNAEAAAEKWAEAMAEHERRQAEIAESEPLLRLARLVAGVQAELARLVRNSDHIHADVVALRELANNPRPECYPTAPRPRRTRGPRKRPAAPEPPTTSPPETTLGGEA